jgi:hypothetical protein
MLNLKNDRNPVWFSLKLFLTVGVFVFPTSQGTIENNEFNKDIQSRSRYISKYPLLSTILPNTICITHYQMYYQLLLLYQRLIQIKIYILNFKTDYHLYYQL